MDDEGLGYAEYVQVEAEVLRPVEVGDLECDEHALGAACARVTGIVGTTFEPWSAEFENAIKPNRAAFFDHFGG
jgi:hypothetical protein